MKWNVHFIVNKSWFSHFRHKKFFEPKPENVNRAYLNGKKHPENQDITVIESRYDQSFFDISTGIRIKVWLSLLWLTSNQSNHEEKSSKSSGSPVLIITNLLPNITISQIYFSQCSIFLWIYQEIPLHLLLNYRGQVIHRGFLNILQGT